MKRVYLVLVLAAALHVVGCMELLKYEDAVRVGLEAAAPMAEAADPLTGGWSGIIISVCGTLTATAFAINRALLLKKKEKKDA